MNPLLQKQPHKDIENDMNTLLLDISNNHFVMEHVQAQADLMEPHVFTHVSTPKPASDPRIQKAMDKVYGKKQALTEAERREMLNAQLAFNFIYAPEEKPSRRAEKEWVKQQLGRFEGLNAEQKMELAESNLREQGKDKPIESISEFDDGLYFSFALAMLETAAQDIEKSKEDIEAYKHEPNSPKYRNAVKTLEVTEYWLNGGDAPFSLEDCAVLLEQELRLQSLDQVNLPDVTARFKELGQWVLNDPHRARKTIRSYHSLFSQSDDSNPYWEISQWDESEDDDAAPEPRRMRLR